MSESVRGRTPAHGERYPSRGMLRPDEPRHREMLSRETLESLRKRDAATNPNRGRGRK